MPPKRGNDKRPRKKRAKLTDTQKKERSKKLLATKIQKSNDARQKFINSFLGTRQPQQKDNAAKAPAGGDQAQQKDNVQRARQGNLKLAELNAALTDQLQIDVALPPPMAVTQPDAIHGETYLVVGGVAVGATPTAP